MKKVLGVIFSLVILSGCAADKGTEVTETSGTSGTVTTAEGTETTTSASKTTTAAAAVPTETTSEEATAVTEPPLPEPVLPEEAFMIDLKGLCEEDHETEWYIIDEENLLVVYSFAKGGGTAAEARIYSIADGEEKVHINVPKTKADTFFVKKSSYFDDENILCKIYGCESNGYDYDQLSETTVYIDYSYEHDKLPWGGSDGYWKQSASIMPGGRKVWTTYYGNIREVGSNKLLLNAVYEGLESKSNIIYSYNTAIDENRFVYSMFGYEWCWGIGIYDFETGEAIDIPDTADCYPIGCHNGSIYMVYSSDGYTDNKIYAVDVNSLEKKILFTFDDDDNPDNYKMTPNGEFLCKWSMNRIFGLYSSDTMELVREYEFEITNIDPWEIKFAGSRAILEDRKRDCLYILDFNK